MAYRRLGCFAPIAGAMMFGLALAACKPTASGDHGSDGGAAAATLRSLRCPGDDGGLTLAPGFCATVFADGIGHARHLAVASDGTVYVNTWSGRYYEGSPPPGGAFIVAMRDVDGDGKADRIERFGRTAAQGAAGGTGIALYKDGLYVEEGDSVLRYPLRPGSITAAGAAQVVLSGMPLTGDHPMHPFAIDPAGQIFVDMGSATNACELRNRQPLSRGHRPCTEKLTRAGIWRYNANRLGQRFSARERYASGIRNGEGLAFDKDGHLFATQHGRDQLGQSWARLYTPQQGAELPAEELLRIEAGADYGWPECYYDAAQSKLVLAPEYGGDGGRAIGPCAARGAPVAAFPAHWAPNDLLIYRGDHAPAPYRGGAFIAFHGSWNRAPKPQGGYNIVFQPLAGGKASGPFVVFADGFAGASKNPGGAAFRPAGLAEGPDGALYVADDVHGRIWRITYRGGGSETAIAATSLVAGISGARASPPEGVHADAGLATSPLAPPPGFTAAQVALGDRIFHGEEADGTCSGCHGSAGGGSSVGPPLDRGRWSWSDGAFAAIRRTIRQGVARPKKYPNAMPAMGGVTLSEQELDAVSAYVWAIGHRGKAPH